MAFNIFTSEQVASWLIYEAKKYRNAREENWVGKDEIDVILGAEHAMFYASKRLYQNIGRDFIAMLEEHKFEENTAKAINLVIGKIELDVNFVNCESEVLNLMCKITADDYFCSISNNMPYYMGRCVAMSHFVDDLCFQLECWAIDFLCVAGIPLDVVNQMLGYKI